MAASVAEAATEAATAPHLLDTSPQRDVRGLTLCPTDHPAKRNLPHNVIPGTPRVKRCVHCVPAR